MYSAKYQAAGATSGGSVQAIAPVRSSSNVVASSACDNPRPSAFANASFSVHSSKKRVACASSVTRSIPSYFFRQVPHCRVINDGADAYRVGAKGAIVGPPIPRGETIYEGPARIAAVSTIPYYGFGFRAFPYAEERPDRMALRVSTITPLPFVRNFPAIWRGDYENPSVMFDYLVEAVTFELDPPTPFQIGGDARGERTRVKAVLSPTTVRLVDYCAPPSAA